ncbi:ropporin-1-like protein [Holotrichia oblita]|uniref:Ropporin-1-like protein n=1 Tax=Holotrichia oblita TaxID=644536 RepID=A0ACB9SW85_HOLOL|nr:ropporin-1-like protein [Holotrichia oblita]
MDAMLQKRCAKYIYVVPEGLRELMSDISREVIRSQPTHIYTFIADYLDALMITRENARVAARLVDSIIRIGTTTVELLLETGLTKQAADRMAAIIQNAFKQYMASKKNAPSQRGTELAVSIEGEGDELGEEQEMVATIMEEYGERIENEEAAARIVQNAFRMFKARHDKEKQMLSGIIDWRVAARSAIYLYRKSGVTYEEANRAATLIKAAYKGYYTRRIMKRLLEEGKMFYVDRSDSVDFEEEEEYELEPRDTADWEDYLKIDATAEEATAGETEGGLTTTDMAETLIDSAITDLPTESEPDQATATSLTEGVGADQTYADDMDMETADYLRLTMGEDGFEDSTLAGILTTGERSSLEGGNITEEMLEGQETEVTPLDFDAPETDVEELPIESVVTEQTEDTTVTEMTSGPETGG